MLLTLTDVRSRAGDISFRCLKQKLEFVQSPVVPELTLRGSNLNQLDVWVLPAEGNQTLKGSCQSSLIFARSCTGAA